MAQAAGLQQSQGGLGLANPPLAWQSRLLAVEAGASTSSMRSWLFGAEFSPFGLVTRLIAAFGLAKLIGEAVPDAIGA